MLKSVIDIYDEGQCRYWAGRFGATREELLAAVNEVGGAACDVERVLWGQEPSNRHLWCKVLPSAIGRNLNRPAVAKSGERFDLTLQQEERRQNCLQPAMPSPM